MNKEEIRNTAFHVWQTGADALNKLKQTVDMNAFSRAVEIIAGCNGRIVTAGVGTSGAAAKKIAHSLSCVERPSFFLDPGDAVHGALGSVQKGDVAILISKGGGTGEILNIIPALETKKVFIIGVTENPESILTEHSSLPLIVKVEKEADEFNMLATTSTMAVTAVFDALCITLMKYTSYSKEQFAVIHPGGAVGTRLTEKRSQNESRPL
jgi:KpsF/GutQ family protein